jgi:hypothetical protein
MEGPTELGDFGKALFGAAVEELPPSGRAFELQAVFVHEVQDGFDGGGPNNWTQQVIQSRRGGGGSDMSSAKADFPDETSALESSVSTLSTSVNQLPASPTPEQLLALAPQITSAFNAADELNSTPAQPATEPGRPKARSSGSVRLANRA